jgi:predicted nucleic acid-binding Zn ribbon protein
VLYPVAIHYKGSGFYTTDYGKGKGAKKDGEPSSTGGESKPGSKAESTSDSKPASSTSSD